MSEKTFHCYNCGRIRPSSDAEDLISLLQETIKERDAEIFLLRTTYVPNLDDLQEENRRLREDLNKISTSAPCKDGHESYNTPGQICDQRIADDALNTQGEGKHG